MDLATGSSTLKYDFESVINKLSLSLANQGLRIVRSFDLQSAWASFPDLTCPSHGDSPCDCQLVVLLVYGVKGTPASIILYTHLGKTAIDLADSVEGRPDPQMVETIWSALDQLVG